MKTLLLVPIAFGLALAGSTANAASIFADDFSSYGSTTVYTAPDSVFAGVWTSNTPSVDYLAASSGYGGLCQGTGNCVDLDGSTNSSGLFQTVMSFVAGTYDLSIHLLGSGRGTTEEVTITLGDWSITISGIASDANQLLNYNITTSVDGVLSFQNSGNDNVGAILTSVEVSSVAAVPVPAGGLLLLTGLAGLAATRRRKV